jgi:hypothetical protein
MKRHAAAAIPNPGPSIRLLFAAALFLALPCHAQQPTETPPGNAALYTLHAYTNLVQIPTLVLNWRSKPLPPIPRDRFAIRLDAGPAFHPTAMHMEGDDAISLAILLDASGDQNDLLQHFDDALATLASTHLLPHDRISVYAIDCTLVKSATDVPANDPVIKSAVTSALQFPALHGTRGKGCAGGIHLRDSIVWIANTLADSPSRRVIVAITDGSSDQSSRPLAQVKYFLASSGVALVALRQSHDPFAGPQPSEDLLRSLCETSGGVLLTSSPQDLQSRLSHIVALLRGRYILEFPQPDDPRPGFHQVDITVPGTHDFIVHTGATVPLPNPSILNDPNTVPTAKSPATYGTRHPVTPNP